MTSVSVADPVLWVRFLDRVSGAQIALTTCSLSQLPAAVDTFRCESACPGRWCPSHTFTTRIVPAEPTLLDLLQWPA